MAKTKEPTVSSLKKKADAAFSEYIRRKYADDSGYSTCVTCGVRRLWKELQCGHYEKRDVNILRYDVRNAHPQCPGCNIFKSGNYPRYATFMVQTYGQSILGELEEEAKELKQFKVYQLQEIIDEYKAKIALLT